MANSRRTDLLILLALTLTGQPHVLGQNSLRPSTGQDIQIQELEFTKNEHFGDLKFSPDGQWLVTERTQDFERALWRLPQSGPPELVTRFSDETGFLRFLSDSRLLRLGQDGLVISAPERTVGTKPIIGAEWFSRRLRSIQASEDGNWLCIVYWDGVGALFRLPNNTAVAVADDLPISRTAIPWFDPKSRWMVVVTSENESEVDDAIRGRLLTSEESLFARYENNGGNWNRVDDLRLFKTEIDTRISADHQAGFLGDSFYVSMLQTFQQWIFRDAKSEHVAIRSLDRPVMLGSKWLVTFGNSDFLKQLDQLSFQEAGSERSKPDYRENLEEQYLLIWELFGDKAPDLVHKLKWRSRWGEGEVASYSSDESHLILNVGNQLGLVKLPPQSDEIEWVSFETGGYPLGDLFRRTCRTGELLAVHPASDDDEVIFYQLNGSRFTTKYTLTVGIPRVRYICFDPLGNHFAVVGKGIRLWRVKDGAPSGLPLDLLSDVDDFYRLEFSPDGKWVYSRKHVEFSEEEGEETPGIRSWRLPDDW